MNDSDTISNVLFLSVGAGSPARIEETLYTPISKSISTGPWRCIVLLPSRDTLHHARELKKRHPQHDVHIRPLPDGVSENDADACYAHFQAAIAELGGPSPANMAVDITRGTKAMSAALLLAAFRHRIARVRYMEGDRDPANPAVIVPGSERVRDVHAQVAFAHRTLDDAHLLFQSGDFAAASVLLRPLDSDAAVVAVIRLADFYSAWDSLDYKSADETHLSPDVPSRWKPCVPSHEVRRWVHQLAQPFPDRGDSNYAPLMAARLRLLIVDLLANGERRIRQRQFEDALLRAYRVLEMLGQARLFDRGLDSARLSSDHEAVRRLQDDLTRKGSAGFGTNPDDTLNAGRELVARLLKRLGDPLAPELLKVGASGALRVASRNHSVLIHGYEAVGPDDHRLLDELYDELRQLLRKDHAEFDEELKIARSANLCGAAGSGAL
jgi:CRISPR-associated protein (TIGR02710 family)